ncbi:glycosyltransferase family 2 protein [Sulfurimonas sp.]|uniref:glycosyltransferase family 2 protein n=1 Tax=Sulfurimonas sp. TaxID=2022749 RepID=UPI0026341AEA|nr:glycosyltransferase family 2 protein [Sulfurimonas sp.]MDD5157863.1 glycosyltransferase family 2 protein [Sulfurimonas sp.]
MKAMQKKIVILLSTYNGEKYLKEQLDSLFAQTYKDFEIITRDDKSSDATLDILKSYNIRLMDINENLGAKNSFATLLRYAVENSNAEYFMFCDQDDIWENNKIQISLIKMQETSEKFGDVPLLVHTDLEVVDEKLHIINNSFMNFQKIDPYKNKFNNLIVQNTITGCTMMINRKLAEKCLPVSDRAIMHDWWIGLVASQFGKISFIDTTCIKYRQHVGNTVGADGFSFKVLFKTFYKIFSFDIVGQYKFQAKAFLEQFEDELDEKTKAMLKDFTELEEKSFWQKRVILWKYKLLKQGFIRNLGLFLKI